MKKNVTYILSFVTALLLFSSCSDEILESDNNGDATEDVVAPTEFNVEIEQFTEDGEVSGEDATSRAYLKTFSGVKHNAWNKLDEISISSPSKSYKLTLKSGADTNVGTFTGDAPSQSDAPIVYPYRASYRSDASPYRGVSSVQVKSFQQAAPTTYDTKSAPMFCVAGGNVTTIQKSKSFQMHNVTALVCIKLGFECDSVVFNANGLEPICGFVQLKYSSDGDWPTVSSSSITEPNYSIGLRANDGGHLLANQEYYLAMIPQTLNSGFTICCRASDDHKVYMFSTSNVTKFKRNTIYRYDKFEKANANGSGVVDLGLPSGTKLAAMNDGAMRISEPGDYYAWGDLEPRATSAEFTPENYTRFSNGTTTGNANVLSNTATLSKYVRESEAAKDGLNGFYDNKTVLDDEDDALVQKYGDKFYRIPTVAIAEEIQANTTIEWTSVTEANATRNGIWIKSKKSGNNNKVWLSLTGFWADGVGYYTGSSAQFRIAELNPTKSGAWITADFVANNGSSNVEAQYSVGWSFRYEGIPVRAVRVKDHTYVDLGAAGKWATCNIGAQTPTQFGDYYAWGEIMPKDTYTADNYKWGKAPNLLKYNSNKDLGIYDCFYTLDADDDAATVNWGPDWYMPSYADFEKLVANTTYAVVSKNGTTGVEFTSKTDKTKSVFFPLAGFRVNKVTTYKVTLGNQTVNTGIYATKTLNTTDCTRDMAYRMSGLSSAPFYGTASDNAYRYYGVSIRPMHK